MKKLNRSLDFLKVFVLSLSVFLFFSCKNSDPSLTNKDGNGAYTTGVYKNLFLEAGHSQQEINNKVNSAFGQLFYGDTSQTIYFTADTNENGPSGYILDVLHNDIRSEGMSYGMMICVQLDKKAEFDALWNWAVTYMYIDSAEHPCNGYFAWSLQRDGTPNSETPASDGEEYFVTSLYFAANRWGNGNGIYNYKAYADTILNTMSHHPVKTGKIGPRNIVVGPMMNEDHKMILFVPEDNNNFTDPSYHLPAFYELWSRWGSEEDSKFWSDAADSSRKFFHNASNPSTGLSSDYANFNGTPKEIVWNPFSHQFSYDSWRTASNWSVDWSWWKKDSGQVDLSNRIQSFFATQGIKSYGSQFTVSGEIINPDHRIGLMSTNAVVSLAASHEIRKEFVEEFWNAPVPAMFDQRYYDGTLYLLSLLHCSGKFKIWKPGNTN